MSVGVAMTSVSVIIRTKNEDAHLGATLERLLAQHTQPDEIIVIDSGSTDDTLAVAGRFPTKIMTIRPDEWSYPGSLNRAAAEASGELLVLLSAHCRPVDDDWLDRLVSHFDDPAVAGVWGPGVRPGDELPPAGPPERQVPGSYVFENRSYGLSNANAAIRRSLWLECPFDERLPAAEDKAWGKAMLDKGYVVIHDPAAVVWHEAHSTVESFRRNHAIQAGYRMMFSELPGHATSQVTVVVRRAWEILTTRIRSRDIRGLIQDLGRLPAVLAAVAGGIRSALRRSYSAHRHEARPARDDGASSGEIETGGS